MTRRWIIRAACFAAMACWCAVVYPQPGKDPDGDTILRNAESRLSSLQDYTVTLGITVDVERLNVPPMQVRMYFKQPDRVHFDAKGFAMLPREGLAMNIGRLRARYDPGSVDRDTLGGLPVYRVTLRAKSDRNRVRTILLYVHPRRWTVEKIVSPGMNDRVMSATFTYAQVQGFWLPEEMVASFSTSPADSTDPDLLMDKQMPVRPQGRPRAGSVTVRYSGYAVNTGLSDDLFKEDAGKSPD